MKFFFPELGLCFGGTIITPETDTVSAVVSTNRRRVTRGGSTKHWRPELSAIAEDGGASTVCQQSHHQSVSGVRPEKKPLKKAKSEGKTPSHSYGGSFRKFNHSMAIPAFSPTPFVF